MDWSDDDDENYDGDDDYDEYHCGENQSRSRPLLGSFNQSEIPWRTVAEDDDDDGDNQLNGDDDNGNDKDDDDDDDGAAITRARSK